MANREFKPKKAARSIKRIEQIKAKFVDDAVDNGLRLPVFT